jgi:hypothetical protein
LGKGALLRPKVLLPALVVAQIPVPWGAGCNREVHHLQSGLQEQAMFDSQMTVLTGIDAFAFIAVSIIIAITIQTAVYRFLDKRRAKKND